MARGGVPIARPSAGGAEHRRWQEAAEREGARYGIDPTYVRAALAGQNSGTSPSRRTWLDWLLVGIATATFIGFGIVARVPQLTLHWGYAGHYPESDERRGRDSDQRSEEHTSELQSLAYLVGRLL